MKQKYLKLPILSEEESVKLEEIIAEHTTDYSGDKPLEYLKSLIPSAQLYNTFFLHRGSLYTLSGNVLLSSLFITDHESIVDNIEVIKEVEVVKEISNGVSEEFALKLVAIAKGEARYEHIADLLKGK